MQIYKISLKIYQLGYKKNYFPTLSICWKYCTVKNWRAQVHLVNKMLQQILLLLALPCKEKHKSASDTVGLQRQIN